MQLDGFSSFTIALYKRKAVGVETDYLVRVESGSKENYSVDFYVFVFFCLSFCNAESNGEKVCILWTMSQSRK